MKLFGNQFNANAKVSLAVALCTVLALSVAPVRAADDNDKDKGASGQLSHNDQNFIKDAARGGMMEVHMGQLGVQKAQSAGVKQFAQRLIDDHTKANTELRQLASSKGITLPEPTKVAGTYTDTDTDRTQVREKTDAESTDHKEHAALKKLEGLSGTEFDREFVKMAVKDHEKDVSEFEKASKKSEDTELKAWIDKTLPTLREHLSQAKSLESQVGNVGAPSTDAGKESGKINNSDVK